MTSAPRGRKLPDEKRDECHGDVDEIDLQPALLDDLQTRERMDDSPGRGNEKALSGHVAQVFFVSGPGGKITFRTVLADPARHRGGEGLEDWLRERGRRVLHPGIGMGVAAAPRRSPDDGTSGKNRASQKRQKAREREENNSHSRDRGERPRDRCGNGGKTRQRVRRGRHEPQRSRRPDADHDAEKRSENHRNPHRNAGFARLRSGPGSGLAQEDDAIGLHETGRRETADERQGRQDGKRRDPPGARKNCTCPESPDRDQPLADETVQGGETTDGDRTDKEGRGRDGHASGEPARGIDVARPGRVENAARRFEEDALEEPVIGDVQQRSRVSQERDGRIVMALSEESHSNPEGDDPDVLDAVVGEEAFQVMLRERVDPEIPGGLVVQQEDVIRDYSVCARLESLRDRLN